MPTTVLTIRFDDHLEQLVHRYWDRLHAHGIQEAGPPRYRPHITLAAYEIEAVEPLGAALPDLAQRISRFPLHLHAVGVFPESGTVFLAPRLTSALFALHRELARFLVPGWGNSIFAEHLLPEVWTPHCTLATRLSPDDVARVLRSCLDDWVPLAGRAEGIGLVVLPEKEDRYHAPFR